jgi:hypothetical protein
MSLWIVAAQGLLTVGVLVGVAYPLMGRDVEEARSPVEADEGEQEREALLVKKQLAYEAIKDLEFERASGKLSEDDYQTVRRELEAEAIGVLKTIDAIDEPEAPAPPPVAPACPSCGHAVEPDHAFCSGCGTKIR